MANFDVYKIIVFIENEVFKFLQIHRSETFYGFAIDANLLCFNSVEQFAQTLEGYRKKWGGYQSTSEIQELKDNTGDWAYQGFAKLDVDNGFDMDANLEHYHANDEDQLNSEYSTAMNRVIELLRQSNVFSGIQKTPDFYIKTVEHNY